MILNDDQIAQLCQDSDAPMIAPYAHTQCREAMMIDNPLQFSIRTIPIVSYGQSSFGYDIRLDATAIDVFRREIPFLGQMIDPKAFDDKQTLVHQLAEHDKTGIFYTLPPHAYALGVSVETFNIPLNVLGICYCKSTYARCGLMVNTTPLEPGWRGQLVLELANLTDLPMKLYANEGVAQVVFFRGNRPRTTYADRSGKYQDQKGIVTARI